MKSGKRPLCRPITAKPLNFPRDFTWGVATAAAQIEGAAFEGGKGPSIWDTYARLPKKIADGSNLDVACDHYHRFKSDFALMKKLGIENYRLSISWPRVAPLGDTRWNKRGLDFYDRLLDSMLAHGITPWVTMYHWDLPQSLEDLGGWRSRIVPDAFAGYAEKIVKLYGDRVKNWFTLNEIICFTTYAYGGGAKAPGTNEGDAVVNQTHHNALLAHGHGVQAVREHGGSGARVGLADNSTVFVPVSETPEDIEAARSLYVDENIRVLDPLYNGLYTKRYFELVGENIPQFEESDFDLISLPTDFLGQNIYTGHFARAGKNGKPEKIPFPRGFPAATCQWLRHMPQVLYWGPRHAAEIYGARNIVITENGAGYDEDVPEGDEVLDIHRRDLVRNYLKETHRAIGDGINISGYFLWSFLDNFEWEDGYRTRFGIVRTDYNTQKRTPKLSANWYSKVIAKNALV